MNSLPDEKKVSVIIPTYNRAKFIPKAVESVINQEYKNIEIIIVDDGSGDNTEEIVKSLQENHPVILYCHNECSKGPSGARNTGILKASGDYLSFLDSDDIWLAGHLKNGLEVFDKHAEIDVLFGNFRVVDFNSGKHLYVFFDKKKLLHTLKAIQISPGINLLQDNLFVALIQENFFHLGSAIIRKSSIEGILMDESIMFAEDRDFAIKLYKQANATFAVRENPVFMSYKHDSNICNTASSNNWQQITEAHLHLFTKYLNTYDLSKSEKKLLTRLIAEKLSTISYIYARNKKYQNAWSHILKSLKYGLTITQIKYLVRILITFLPFANANGPNK